MVFWLNKEGFYWSRKIITLDFFDFGRIITLDFFDFWQIITLDNFIFYTFAAVNQEVVCITKES